MKYATRIRILNDLIREAAAKNQRQVEDELRVMRNELLDSYSPAEKQAAIEAASADANEPKYSDQDEREFLRCETDA